MADLFVVEDPWGDPVHLTRTQWSKIARKHPEVEPYPELVRTTIVRPELVFEALAAPDSKAFYSAVGAIPDRRFRACRVAVIVRYPRAPASIATVYFPVRLSGTMGARLL